MSQMGRCEKLRNTWIKLIDGSRTENDTRSLKDIGSGDSGSLASGSDLNSSHIPGEKGDYSSTGLSSVQVCKETVQPDTCPTHVFPSIAEAMHFASQGNIPLLSQDARTSLPPVSERLRTSGRIHILCTGSLHLIGGILGVLDVDPFMND